MKAAVCTRTTLTCNECGRSKCARCGRCYTRKPISGGTWRHYCPSTMCRVIKHLKRLL